MTRIIPLLMQNPELKDTIRQIGDARTAEVRCAILFVVWRTTGFGVEALSDLFGEYSGKGYSKWIDFAVDRWNGTCLEREQSPDLLMCALAGLVGCGKVDVIDYDKFNLNED